MKCFITDAKSFNYTDKKTGETIPAIVLGLIRNVPLNPTGKGVKEQFVGKKYQESLYNHLMLICNGDCSFYSGKVCEIDYDGNEIIDFRIIKTDKPAVTWGF